MPHEVAPAPRLRRDAALSLLHLLLAPAFGCGMGGSYIAGSLLLERALTPRMATAGLHVAIAGTAAALLALLAVRLLRRRPRSARLAAALFFLIGVSGSLAPATMAVQIAWSTHPLPELPPGTVAVILALIGAGSLYSFLSIAAWIMLPLALPLILVFAGIIARTPR